MTQPRIDDEGRIEPPMDADERATLVGYLNYQRQTLEWKVRGLSDAQLSQSLAPTAMTLAGLVGHLAYVEDFWFGTVIAIADPPAPWGDIDWDADEDWDWHQDPAYAGQLWQASKTRSDQVLERSLAAPGALGEVVPAWGGREHVSLRWILTHMIEEYARHNGHADLLRESIDGQTGE